MAEIVIFEKIKNKLFAVCFEGSGHLRKDELDKALDFWRDIEVLREFFNQYREDLAKFDSALKVKAAVKQVSEEAEDIYDHLIEASNDDNLDELFKPLDNRELLQRAYELQKLKAKPKKRKSMLRLYAVKFRDWYVVTGAAIKLTDKMDSRPHLKRELIKLESTRKYLQQGSDIEGVFVYLDI